MSISIRQMTAFLAVAEHGSFTRAAEHTGLAQPALSQIVREIENELGLRLFDRTTRRVELTDAGREFRAAVAKVMDDLDFAVRSIRDLAGRKRGRIAIAAPPLLAAVLLPSAIKAFGTTNPEITIVVLDVAPKDIVETVRTGQADCGLGTFAAGEPGIERVVLTRDSLALFGPAGDAAAGTTISWKALADIPLITLTRESGIRKLVEVGFSSAEIPLVPAHEVTHVSTAMALVEAGLGYAVMPTYADAEARFRKLTVRPLIEPRISRDVVMIHASGRSLSPALRAFVPVLTAFARNLTPATERSGVKGRAGKKRT